MTEQEWLRCADPAKMVSFLCVPGDVGDRKLRLFACACCRRIWDVLDDPRSRLAVETAERFADGLVRSEDLEAARTAALAVEEAARTAHAGAADNAFAQRFFASRAAHEVIYPPESREEYQHFILTCGRITEACLCAAEARHPAPDGDPSVELAVQCGLLRCIVGWSPFRPVHLDLAWMAWQAGNLLKMAQSIYDSQSFEDIPILADALEEAGCTNEDILSHCRQPGEHARGCWALDLILGKS
jgi:hypothetical protein